jgi:transcriptional regulator with XRE-family HTH domain
MDNTLNDAVIIGRNLKGLRMAFGYSQKQIGRILGVSFQQVQKYESGVNRLPVEKLYRLQKLYGVPYSSFFGGLNDADIKVALDPVELILKRVSTMEDQHLKRKIYEVNLILLGEAFIAHTS